MTLWSDSINAMDKDTLTNADMELFDDVTQLKDWAERRGYSDDTIVLERLVTLSAREAVYEK